MTWTVRMTNRTRTLPRTGAGVLFGTQDTPACSNRTANRTRPEREQDNEQDTAEQDTLHAHEQDNLTAPDDAETGPWPPDELPDPPSAFDELMT